MIADFKNGIDIHTNGATLCCEAAWKLPRAKWDKMTKDERDPYRSQIKTVIFGRLYGKTDKGIAREFGVSVGTIVQINKMIWGRYKKLERFMQACVTESRRTGEAWTWWDGGRARVRPIWRILDQDQAMRAHYERTAGNTSVQGTAAEFATASLSPIVEWLVGDAVPGQLVCTVHDSIMLNVHRSAAYEARYQLKRIMLSHNSNGVPLGVDVKWGPSWGSLTDMSEEKE
jgi:DNA polymerase-1